MAGLTFDDRPGRGRPAGSTAPAAPAASTGGHSFEDRPGRQLSPAQEMAKQQSELSWPARVGQGVMDTIGGVNQAFYGGMAPYMHAGIGVATGRYPDYSSGVDQEIKNVDLRRQRSPVGSTIGEVAGGAAQYVTGAKALPLGAAVSSKIGGDIPARIAGFGLEGALYGGANAAGNTYTGNRLDAAGKGAFMGGLLGGATGATVSRSAVTPRPGDPRTGQPLSMPEDKLSGIVKADYDVFSQIPATYSSRSFLNHLNNIEDKLLKAGATDATAQQVYAVMSTLRQGGYGGAGGNVTPQMIELAVRSVNNAKNMPTAGTQMAGSAAKIFREGMHDFVRDAPTTPGVVTSRGTAARDAADVGERMRGNYAALAASRDISDPARNAANVAATGGEAVAPQVVREGNRLRAWENGQQPELRGWKQEQRDQLATAITPTLPERAANSLASSLPTFPVSTQAKNALEGYSSRGIARRWNDLAEAHRQTSPAYQQEVTSSVPVPGPGMNVPTQAALGAGTQELVTPYGDGRDGLAWSWAQQLMQ